MWNASAFAIAVSAVIGGLWVARMDVEEARWNASSPAPASVSLHTSSVSLNSNVEVIASRRARIERLLENIDAVRTVSQRMTPERAVLIEMVLDEMSQEAKEMANEKALASSATDEKLAELESDLNRLIAIFSRLLEPELKL